MSQLEQVQGIVDRYRNDPHVWGLTKQVAGGLLIADGLVGLENPFDGKKTRPGVADTVTIIFCGLIFMFVGLFIVSNQPDTDAETTGQVIAVHQHRSTDRATCSLTADYQVDGTTYTADSTGSTSSTCRTSVGSAVTVRYQSDHPEVGEVKSGGDRVMWIPLATGGFMVIIGLGKFLVRAASIIGGVMLIRSGRKQAQENPASNGNAGAAVAEVKQEVTALLMAARRKVAAAPATTGGGAATIGDVGGRLGRFLGLGALSSHTPQPPAPAHVAPPVSPPGWYPTADGQHERYWDGSVWSAESRPTSENT